MENKNEPVQKDFFFIFFFVPLVLFNLQYINCGCSKFKKEIYEKEKVLLVQRIFLERFDKPRICCRCATCVYINIHMCSLLFW